MKTPRTFFRAFLLLTLLLAGGNIAVAQTDSCAVNVIHTYMNGQPIQWDSVKVKVQDAPYHTHSFMLYWPDTLLSNCPTGINEYLPDKELGLSQNYPNPCQGKSSMMLLTRTSGNVTLQIIDLQGRLCCQSSTFLPAGEHLLSLRLPSSGFYLVNAQTEKGSDACKVLCTKGSGSDYDIKVTSSSSCQFVEKVGKGGEGQFNMTDRMEITAFITYNDSVWTKRAVVNTYFDDYIYINDSLYQNGSVNIHFMETDSCNDFSLSGHTYDILVSVDYCQPFMDYPLGNTVTFYDSTFYAVPGPHFQQLSSSFYFGGWFKYRYTPNQIRNLYICTMDEDLPIEDSKSPDDYTSRAGWTRALVIESCDIIYISTYGEMNGYVNMELMIKRE